MSNDLTVPAQAQPPAEVFNPLDADTGRFRAELVKRSANYDALKEHLRGVLVAGKDFGRIHVARNCADKRGCQNPAHMSGNLLFAAGADKILGVFGLGVAYPDEADYRAAVLAGVTINEVITKAYVVDHHGRHISEGTGACGRDEVQGSLNNAMKRAAKRARLDAVQRLPGISSLFEDEFLSSIPAGANGLEERQYRVQPAHDTGAILEVMPFGKHKGTPFSRLPVTYLEWLAKGGMADKPDITRTAEAELQRLREVQKAAPPPFVPPPSRTAQAAPGDAQRPPQAKTPPKTPPGKAATGAGRRPPPDADPEFGDLADESWFGDAPIPDDLYAR